IVKHTKEFFLASTLMVDLGGISLTLFQLNPDIVYTRITRVEKLSDEAIDSEDIYEGLEQLGLDAKSIVISGDQNEIAVSRFDSILSKEEVNEVKQYFGDQYGNEPNVSVVSPIVGQELVKNAAMAVAIASVGMILYVTIRFELFFGITAIIALLHDAFFMLVLFSVTRIEFDVTIVAAILTIIGYSINDTI